MIERQVDVEDVLRCESTCRLDEGSSPNPLMGDNGCFRQTFQGQRRINHLGFLDTVTIRYMHFLLSPLLQYDALLCCPLFLLLINLSIRLVVWSIKCHKMVKKNADQCFPKSKISSLLSQGMCRTLEVKLNTF